MDIIESVKIAEEKAEAIKANAKIEAQKLIAEGEKQAKAEAQKILENAKAEAEELVNEQEITAIANERAEKVVEQAKQDAIKMRDITLQYIDSVITEGEKSLGNALGTLNQLKQSYSGSKTEQ